MAPPYSHDLSLRRKFITHGEFRKGHAPVASAACDSTVNRDRLCADEGGQVGSQKGSEP